MGKCGRDLGEQPKPHSIILTFVNMKQFYSLTTILMAFFFINFSGSAQTYTAVRPGNWQADIPAHSIWDVSGQPPANCINCVITLQSGPAVTGNAVTLNTSITLSGTSKLLIGDNAGPGGAQLSVPTGGSGGAGFATGFNIIMDNPGNTGSSKIVLFDNNSTISIPPPTPAIAGRYDGVFSSNNGFLKVVGSLPVGFNADGSVQFNGMSVNSSLTGPVTLSAPGDLPIILTAFSAALDNKVVDLNWTTSMEINSDQIVIERSTDAGGHWNALGTVAAHRISSLPIDYSFTDGAPGAGTNEYRLRLVDLDGKYAYSVVKSVRMGLVSSVSLYPNPARDYVNVSLGGEAVGSVSIRLISQSGQLLLEKKLEHAAGTTVALPVGLYPQGNYLVLVTGADGVTQTSKLLISKQ